MDIPWLADKIFSGIVYSTKTQIMIANLTINFDQVSTWIMYSGTTKQHFSYETVDLAKLYRYDIAMLIK